jgi:hypothetical protein
MGNASNSSVAIGILMLWEVFAQALMVCLVRVRVYNIHSKRKIM